MNFKIRAFLKVHPPITANATMAIRSFSTAFVSCFDPNEWGV